MNFLLSSPEGMLIDFREGRGGREEEKYWCARETPIDCLVRMHAPQLGTELATQAGAQTRNWARDLLVYKMMLQPTEPHLSGLDELYKKTAEAP